MHNLIQEYFKKEGVKFSQHLEEIVTAIMKSGSVNTYAIVRQLCEMNKKSFKTNDMKVYRFLKNPSFQIDDGFWRNHINLIFELLEENRIISKESRIQIDIDTTTIEDNFLILSASVLLFGKAITIYFTMRNYPKKKNQMSQKKMEEAFIKGLRHVLSKKYKYLIVGDRVFGNGRFVKLCEANDFGYVLRVPSHLKITKDGKTGKLGRYKKEGKFDAYVTSWGEEKYFTICCKGLKMWYLVSNMQTLDVRNAYENRFKIEKHYQDCKSSGYNIEKNKIRKYDRFKRLTYCVMLAHALTCFIGVIINYTENNIKKNFVPYVSLNLRLILAFLKLDISLSPSILDNPLLCYVDQQNLY